MELVITGSESFIGSALARQCARRGVRCGGVDLTARPGSIAMDIRDPRLREALPAADALIHLAAVSRDGDCRRDPAAAASVNVSGTLNVLAAARAAGIPRIVFASSEWVYSGCTPGRPFTEETPIDINRVTSEYALTKLAGERLLAMAAAGGLSVAALRFGIVYGPRPDNWSAVESLFEACRPGGTVETGSAATARCFVHVDDVAAAILAACRGTGFRVYNIGGPLASLGDVIAASCRIHGSAPRLAERDPANPSVRAIDSSRARDELGWTPAIDLETGLRGLPGREAAA